MNTPTRDKTDALVLADEMERKLRHAVSQARTVNTWEVEQWIEQLRALATPAADAGDGEWEAHLKWLQEGTDLLRTGGALQTTVKMQVAIDQLRAALSRPAADSEAVAWMCKTANGYTAFSASGPDFPVNSGEVTPLFTRPSAAAVPEVDDAMARIGQLIHTQDNRITDAPIFIVQQKRQRVAHADYDNDGIVWVNDDHQEADAEEYARLEAAFREDGDEPVGWRRLAVRDEWEFVTACFTEHGCKEYFARNGHNLCEPRIYAAGSYRNEEWRAVRKHLMALTPAPRRIEREDAPTVDDGMGVG
jgi:hypothetical protein